MRTRFMDMCSGGGQKEKWGHIYIEAPYSDALVIFENRFGHFPLNVTCQCCGEDYAVEECESLEAATAYERGCKWDDLLHGWRLDSGKSVDEYVDKGDALVIPESDIKPGERKDKSE